MKKRTLAALCALIMALWRLPALAAEDGYANEDLNPVTDLSAATVITLSDDGSVVTGGGAQVQDNVITIVSPGTYAVSGTLSEGRLVVDLLQSGKVYLVLCGVSIHCTESAAIHVLQAKKVLITLADGTENFVSDGKQGVTAQLGEDDPTAAIFSKDDLVFNGEGSLTVTANRRDGITGRDTLKFASGRYNITAADDGIVGKDCLMIRDGSFTISAASDGMKSTNATESAKGYITLSGGVYDITCGNDGVQAETVLTISGGSFSVNAGGGSANASYDAKAMSWNGGWGQWGADADEEGADTDSAKGLKAGVQLVVSGGTFGIDSSDDALHSNGSVDISGGTLDIASGDDGVHADGTLAISGGIIHISKSYEGLEAQHLTISGGETTLTAADDGLNAAGGQDESALNRPGRGGFQPDGNGSITLSGGKLLIDADGDGIDANGSVTMSGGEVTVIGPEGSGNGALDYDGSFQVTGGTLIAMGSAGMAQAPSDSQVPCLSLGCQAAAGDAVTLMDSAGNVIWSYTADQSFQSLIYASDALTAGDYTLTVGGQSYQAALEASGVTSVNGGGHGTGGFGAGFGSGGPGGGKRR